MGNLAFHCVYTYCILCGIHYLCTSGQRAKSVRLMCRGMKVSAIAAVALDGLVSVRCSMNSVNEEFCDFIERNLLPHLLMELIRGVSSY